jgi:hypothetical protein
VGITALLCPPKDGFSPTIAPQATTPSEIISALELTANGPRPRCTLKPAR